MRDCTIAVNEKKSYFAYAWEVPEVGRKLRCDRIEFEPGEGPKLFAVNTSKVRQVEDYGEGFYKVTTASSEYYVKNVNVPEEKIHLASYFEEPTVGDIFACLMFNRLNGQLDRKCVHTSKVMEVRWFNGHVCRVRTKNSFYFLIKR